MEKKALQEEAELVRETVRSLLKSNDLDEIRCTLRQLLGEEA
jgi:hypothetical protein